MNIRLHMSADELVNQAFDALSRQEIEPATALLREAIVAHPLDSRFRVLNAALANAQGRRRDAWDSLWHGLAAQPQSDLCRRELVQLVVACQAEAATQGKDYSLDSGERQTATKAALIRMDHRLRYAFAARWIHQNFATPRRCTGLDVFCGNGYGSHMLASLAGVRMLGLDGSSEAVELAETHYGSHRVVFGQALHPFTLTGPWFDFVISLESIEHVNDPAALLQQMAVASDGPFIISVPNEERLPFARLSHRFQHHVRHFRRREILELLEAVGRTRVLAEYGQDTYRIDSGDLAGLLPEREMHLQPLREDAQFLIMVVG